MLSTDEKLVFLDLETAGLETWRPIIQLAAIAVDSDLTELESFEVKIRFDQTQADPKSLNKNHYCPRLWSRYALPEHQVAQEFSKFLRRHATLDRLSSRGSTYQLAQLVAHNGNFDGPFLAAWYQRLGLFMPAAYRVFCTMQRALWLFHEDKSLTPPDDYKLTTLCQYFNIPLPAHEAHDALNDVRATLSLYREFSRQETLGHNQSSNPSQELCPHYEAVLREELSHGRFPNRKSLIEFALLLVQRNREDTELRIKLGLGDLEKGNLLRLEDAIESIRIAVEKGND